MIASSVAHYLHEQIFKAFDIEFHLNLGGVQMSGRLQVAQPLAWIPLDIEASAIVCLSSRRMGIGTQGGL